MLFSHTECEKAGSNAYLSGLQRNRNPFIGKQGFVNNLKEKIWNWGYDKAENDCRSA